MTFLQFSKKSSAASGGGDLRRHHANRASEFAARAGLAPPPIGDVSPKPPLFFRAWGWRQRRNSTADANRSMILPGPACPLYDEHKSHQRSAQGLDVTRSRSQSDHQKWTRSFFNVPYVYLASARARVNSAHKTGFLGGDRAAAVRTDTNRNYSIAPFGEGQPPWLWHLSSRLLHALKDDVESECERSPQYRKHASFCLQQWRDHGTRQQRPRLEPARQRIGEQA